VKNKNFLLLINNKKLTFNILEKLNNNKNTIQKVNHSKAPFSQEILPEPKLNRILIKRETPPKSVLLHDNLHLRAIAKTRSFYETLHKYNSKELPGVSLLLYGRRASKAEQYLHV